jgi:hypothetical protein
MIGKRIISHLRSFSSDKTSAKRIPKALSGAQAFNLSTALPPNSAKAQNLHNPEEKHTMSKMVKTHRSTAQRQKNRKRGLSGDFTGFPFSFSPPQADYELPSEQQDPEEAQITPPHLPIDKTPLSVHLLCNVQNKKLIPALGEQREYIQELSSYQQWNSQVIDSHLPVFAQFYAE